MEQGKKTAGGRSGCLLGETPCVLTYHGNKFGAIDKNPRTHGCAKAGRRWSTRLGRGSSLLLIGEYKGGVYFLVSFVGIGIDQSKESELRQRQYDTRAFTK